MSTINVSSLTFAYEGSWDNIFENASFSCDTSWRLGLVGRNGRGKTTLLNLLMGKYAYQGTISADAEFVYFPIPTSDENAPVLDILAQICPTRADWELIRELFALGMDAEALYRPFSTLSGGERTKALLAALFLKEGAFPLIDEPTNHLDRESREIVSRYLAAQKGFILVSLDRAFLDGCTDHILAINRTGIELTNGSFFAWQRERERRDAFERAGNEKLKKDVKRLDAAARRTAVWSDKVEKTKTGTRVAGLKPDRGNIGHKAAKMMKRSKSIDARRKNALAEKSCLLKNVETPEELKISPLVYHSQMLAELCGVSVSFGQKIACRDVSFSIERGERVALTGRNGTGKSTVLKLLTGENTCYTGELRIGSGVVVSYLPQDVSHLSGSLLDYADRFGIDGSLYFAILRKLGFERVHFEKDLSALSEGQKKKAVIARSLSERAHLYIWDEPLNYIDVVSRIQIERLLAETGPAMLFVEHDSAFVRNIATKEVRL